MKPLELTELEYKRQLLKELVDIVKDLGWDVALPMNPESEDYVDGMIIGTTEYVEDICDLLERVDLKTE